MHQVTSGALRSKDRSRNNILPVLAFPLYGVMVRLRPDDETANASFAPSNKHLPGTRCSVTVLSLQSKSNVGPFLQHAYLKDIHVLVTLLNTGPLLSETHLPLQRSNPLARSSQNTLNFMSQPSLTRSGFVGA